MLTVVKRNLRPILIVCLLAGIAVAAERLYFSSPSQSRASFGVLPIKDCEGCNVVVIVVDTLRADHLPMYGYERNTSPFLNELAQQSAVFEHGYSTSSWTAPATASLFTSLFPSRHGVITGLVATKKLRKNNRNIEVNRIPLETTTITEFMKQAGYQTVGITDNINIGKGIGFDRSFDRFANFSNKGAAQLNKTARLFLNDIKEQGPYFLYLHYMDPHSPYQRQEPWYSECMKEHSNKKMKAVRCAYDSEITYTDGHIKELFEEYGWLDNAVVFITADHGEEFWDHGQLGHGHTLYRELIHVPLIVRHPNRPALRVEYKVQPMDIMPTLARFMDQPLDPNWEGRSFRKMLRGLSPKSRDRVVYSERLKGIEISQQTKRSVIRGNWHYIESGDTAEGDTAIQSELYNLSQDSAELMNVYEQHSRGVADELKLQLAQLKEASPVLSEENKMLVPMDKELVNQLRTLGYLK